MPRLTRQLPSYRQHRPSGQAVVTVNGRTIYLGRYDTPESRNRYDNLITQYLLQGRKLRDPGDPTPLTVSRLAELYVAHAATYYVKHGQHTSEYDQIRRVLAVLTRFHGTEDLPIQKLSSMPPFDNSAATHPAAPRTPLRSPA